MVLVAFPGAQILDISGPIEVFANANRRLGNGAETAYRVEIAATQSGPVATSAGVEVVAHKALRDVRGPIDTLIVAGGEVGDALRNRPLVRGIRRRAERARRVASVCSGAFLLAEAGLLNGRRVTTHWNVCHLPIRAKTCGATSR